MLFVDVANLAQAVQSVLIPDLTAQCVTRVGRIHDQPARAQYLDGLPHKAALRIAGVYSEVLGHVSPAERLT